MSLQGESTSDEAVLAPFPTSVRRRILRQLYSEPLDGCYLFKARRGARFCACLCF
jgi:hypothetical protein